MTRARLNNMVALVELLLSGGVFLLVAAFLGALVPGDDYPSHMGVAEWEE